MFKLLEKKIEDVKNSLEKKIEDVKNSPSLIKLQLKQESLEREQFILTDPKLTQFHRHFQLVLNRYFLALMVMESGKFEKAKDNINKGLDSSREFLGLMGIIPGIGTFTSIGSFLLKKINSFYNRQKHNALQSINVSVSKSETMVENISQRLTLRYQNQIRKLSIRGESGENEPKDVIDRMKNYISSKLFAIHYGVQKLADCAVARILVSLIDLSEKNDQNPNTDLEKLLVDSVFSLENKAIDKPIATSIRLNPEDYWWSEGIFRRSGIEYHDKDEHHRFKIMNKTDWRCGEADKYGYRLGTESEVEKERKSIECFKGIVGPNSIPVFQCN